MVLHIGIFLLSFAFMEFVAWFTHKYIMHGFLWSVHRDHHQRDHDSFFERNDLFFLIFAIPGILFIFFGFSNHWMDYRLWIGAGITLYGMVYVLVHDIFIHQRLKIFEKTKNIYLNAIQKAHGVHHTPPAKGGGGCFGFLWVPRKYLAETKMSNSMR